MRGHSILPDAPKRWRPKTRAAALAALEDSRRYAARLEAASQQQLAREHELRAELDKLRARAAHGQQELTATQSRLEQVEQKRDEKVKENYKRKQQAERLVDRLKRTEREVARREKTLDQTRAELAALRRTHEQQSVEQASQLADARAEITELSKVRNELAAKTRKLAETTEQLEQRAAGTEQKLKQRDGELDNERKQADEAKREREESQAHIELLQRRLEAEQARRTAAEQKLEQGAHAGNLQPQTNAPDTRSTWRVSSLRFGRYGALAAAIGHDAGSDPLLMLMHEEVLVATAYADWQAAHMERITSRQRDIEQSLDEQAYAGAIAARWNLINHPHVRLGTKPYWQQVGGWLDVKSEKYLLTITRERIEVMKRRIGQSAA